MAAIRLAEAGLYAIIAWSGLAVARVAAIQVAPTLGISMSIPYAAIAVGAALSCLVCLAQAVRAARSRGI